MPGPQQQRSDAAGTIGPLTFGTFEIWNSSSNDNVSHVVLPRLRKSLFQNFLATSPKTLRPPIIIFNQKLKKKQTNARIGSFQIQLKLILITFRGARNQMNDSTTRYDGVIDRNLSTETEGKCSIFVTSL